MLSLALAPGAFAANEVGDAGDLRVTANDMGDTAVTRIVGSFTGASDADVYRICLSTGASFSASTVGGTLPASLDTQLFLFDQQGFGVYANDDWPESSHGSTLPANHRFSPATGGVYYLAVSQFNRDPQSSLGEIFPDSYSPSTYPDDVVDASGSGGAETLSSWDGRAPGTSGTYRIVLTGTAVCAPPDTTKPTVNITSPVDGSHVERNADVTADYECADEANGSGIDTCVGDVPDGADVDTSTLGEHSFTVTATDHAGNDASAVAHFTVVDVTAPVITLATPSQDATYDLGQQVAASYACADETGGSGLASCAGTVANGAAVDTSSVGQKSFTVSATDNAGNPASQTVTYTVVDRAAPDITLSSPADGAVYGFGDRVLADYSCADQPGGSGVATCTGTVANGAPIDTASFGSHVFEVHATDGAGNPATKTVTYSVVYDFDGFFWPVKNPPGVTRWKAGVPVPVRFSLGGFRGARPEADGYPRSVRCGGGDMQVARAAQGKHRPAFEYDKRSDRYWMLWRTDKRWAGSCRDFVLKLDDGSVHTARFEFVKKRDRDRDSDS